MFKQLGNLYAFQSGALERGTINKFAAYMNLSEADTYSLRTGIDLTKPISINRLNSNKSLWQYQSPGAPQGNWYTLSSETTPSRLGIGTYGLNRTTMSVEAKVLNLYKTNQPVSVLRSSSKPIIDSWSIPYASFKTEGGGIQLFSPQKNSFYLKPKP